MPLGVQQSTFTKDHLEQVSVKDLFAGDAFPWKNLSKICQIRTSNKIADLAHGVKKLIYFLYSISFIFSVIGHSIKIHRTYKEAYTQTNCSQYYIYNFESSTHERIFVRTNLGNGTDSKCDNSPIYFFGVVFAELLRVSICMGWFYAIDSRYGVLKLCSEEVIIYARDMKIFVQLPIILMALPMNVIIATIFTYIALPIIVMLAIFNWIIECSCVNGVMERYLDKSEIVFLYLVLTIQDVTSFCSGCVLTIVGATQFHLEYDTYVNIVCVLHCGILIYRVLHIARNRIYFEIFVAMIFRILPFLLAIWEHADVILDIVQANKYKRLSATGSIMEDGTTYSISHNYFLLSVTSFIFPVVLTFALILYNYKGFKVLELTLGDDARYSKFIVTCFFVVAEITVGIPTYLFLSAIFCYIVIPAILTRHGIHTIAKGQDEDRPIDWDPFQIISKLTGLKGILDLYGFKDVRSNCLPLISGIEQLGEASIQTILSLIFISNNYEFISKEDAFLGVPCPVSLLSLIFSIVSLLIGFCQMSNIIRYLIEENKKGVDFSKRVVSLHKGLRWSMNKTWHR